MSVIAFPLPHAVNAGAPSARAFAAPPLPDPPWRARIAFAEIVTALGLDCLRTTRAQVARLRALHVHCGFPLPLAPRIWGGQMVTGASNITPRALWDRGTFLAWLDHARTPPTGEHPDAGQTRDSRVAAEIMADRARRMVSGGVA